MKKLVSMVAMFTMLFSLMVVLTGCGEKDKFIGTWKAEMDLAGEMNKELAGEEEMAEYIKINSFPLAINFTFYEDGTYEMSADKDSCDKAIEGMKADFADGMKAYVEAMIAEEDLGVSVDEFFALSGMTFEEVIEESFSEFDTDSMIGELHLEGNFEAEGGKLYLSDGKDMLIDKNIYEFYEFDGADLKLVESVGGGEEVLQEFYPMVFKKVQ